jgi:hypothetical protein
VTLDISHQPDDASCGPTCLHAVYRYFGESADLAAIIAEVEPLETGGTLAVSLATHALRRGFRASIYTYNLQLFDPTWFQPGVDIAAKLIAQTRAKRDRKLRFASAAYCEYLELGGRLKFEELTPDLIRSFLKRRVPILTGLSATYLYESPRERGELLLVDDDVAGEPTGHFVILAGYDAKTREVLVVDPQAESPRFRGHRYRVGLHRLIGAILLGVLTYDANLLIIEPPEAREA